MLGLGTLLELVDLLDNQGLDLLLHDGGLLLDDFFGFSCLVLDDAGILPSQLSNKLLDLTFFLSLEALEVHQTIDTLVEAHEHII